MSKPQFASEPSMEDILASIRKMISDDRPGPSPMPDQMSRTPFAQSMQAAAVSEFNARHAGPAGPAQPSGGQPASFNSLADALKVATALSDQRRSLQQEIAQVLEKGPRGEPGASTPASARLDNLHALPDANGAKSESASGPRLPNFPDWRGEPGGAADGKRELMSFDFGTVVPQREDVAAKAAGAAAEAAEPAANSSGPEAASVASARADSKSEGKTEPQSAEEGRVLSLPARPSSALNGSSLNGSGAHATGSSGTSSNGSLLNGASLNGSGVNGGTVAPFPRTPREVAKPVAETVTAPAPVEKPAEKPAAKIGESATPSPATAAEPSVLTATTPATKSDAASAHTEALLDAVVDLVHQQPGALSVFTSGASFIGGVGGKKSVADAILSATKQATPESPDASGAPPKIDRAAAELLRPMLRQWLADNMPRIVEEALRSELTDQTQGDGKGPGKA